MLEPHVIITTSNTLPPERVAATRNSASHSCCNASTLPNRVALGMCLQASSGSYTIANTVAPASVKVNVPFIVTSRVRKEDSTTPSRVKVAYVLPPGVQWLDSRAWFPGPGSAFTDSSGTARLQCRASVAGTKTISGVRVAEPASSTTRTSNNVRVTVTRA
jgi:hypothetical protein